MKDMPTVAVIDDGGDGALESYQLQVTRDYAQIEVKRLTPQVWLLRITEPSERVSEIRFSADTEVSAIITSD